jgi:uroporphyrinogen III methyltransferase/synthase
MADGLPLAGKRVVVTRAAEQAEGLGAELERLGAEVVYLPLVRYEPLENNQPLDEVLWNLAEFDWLILTSQNAVRFLTARRETLPGRSAALTKIAAVGTATADAAQAAGWDVDFVSSRATGEALAQELGERVRRKRVLLPRSDRARPDLPEALRRAGAEMIEVVAYRTVFADLRNSPGAEILRNGRVDVITFASPSAFQGLVQAFGAGRMRELAEISVFAAIGPTTAGAIRDAGLPVRVQAEESSAGALAQAIAEHFEKQKTTSGAKAR